MSEAESDDAAARLARDLRQSVGTFVRAVRHDSGTQRSAQSETLDLLHRDGPMNVASLASRRGVTHQTMRLVVAELEAGGLVRQDPDPADRRSRLATLTLTGKEALDGERQARTARIETAIRRLLSQQEQDVLRTAVPLLDRLSKAP